MGDLPRRRWRTIATIAAVAWLVVLAPAELTATLARLISGPTDRLGLTAATLIALRVMVTAGGLVLGRRLASGGASVRPLALAWAAGDLCTLALVLASGSLPSDRAPGDALIVWWVYAGAAAIVIAAASPTSAPGSEA